MFQMYPTEQDARRAEQLIAGRRYNGEKAT
jgi:hypothetical protein